MIDCGMPFKKMKQDLYKCEALLITHSHSDHITEKTYSSILKSFPRITTYANADVAYRYMINTVIGEAPFRTRSGTIITPHDGEHDVPVTWFTFNLNGSDIIYATDTCELKCGKDEKFDYLFIESNYDEQKLREIGKQYKVGGYDPTMSNLRHLSTQQCKAFYYMHRKSPDSVLIELHKSSRFY